MSDDAYRHLLDRATGADRVPKIPNCAVCRDSGIEFIAGGHGNIIEERCSMCHGRNTGLNGVFNFNTDIGDGCLACFASTDLRDTLSAANARLIITIHVPREKRKQGHGSRILDAACELADEYHIDLYVDPRPFDACHLDVVDMIAWYERRGFTEFGGVWRRRAQ